MKFIKKLILKISPKPILKLIERYSFVKINGLFHSRPLNSTLKLIRWTIYEWFGKEISFVTPDKTHFISMPNNYSSFAVYFTNFRDPNIQSFLNKKIAKGSIFVDAGANIGTYTVRASQVVGEMGKVIAIEAHPFTYDYLLRNIRLNNLKNVIPVNIALGSEHGTTEIVFNQTNAGETHIATSGEKSITIPMQSLDEILSRLNISKVDYLKIDVEGFEFPLLLGAKNIIKNNQNIIIQTELDENHPNRYGHPLSEINNFLFGLELTPHKIDSVGKSSIADKNDLRSGDVLWWREIKLS